MTPMLIPKVPLNPRFSKTIAEQKFPIVYPVMKHTSNIETLELIVDKLLEILPVKMTDYHEIPNYLP